MTPLLVPRASAAALSPEGARPVPNGASPNAVMMPNGRVGVTPGRVVEDPLEDSPRVFTMPASDAGIGTSGREDVAEEPLEDSPRVFTMPASDAGIGTSGREDVAEEPLEDSPRVFTKPASDAGIGTSGREDVAEDPLEDSPRVFTMPAPGAGIGTSGRNDVAMDPLEDSPRDEPSRTAMMPKGRADETSDLEEASARAPVFFTEGPSCCARTAMIPKRGEPSPEDIRSKNTRSLHHPDRGGGAARRENAGRTRRGPAAFGSALRKGRGFIRWIAVGFFRNEAKQRRAPTPAHPAAAPHSRRRVLGP